MKGNWSVYSYSLQIFIVAILAIVVGVSVWKISGKLNFGIVFFIVYLESCFILSAVYVFKDFSIAPFLKRHIYKLAYLAPIVAGSELLIFIWRTTEYGNH